jgi:hypothetical protein
LHATINAVRYSAQVSDKMKKEAKQKELDV